MRLATCRRWGRALDTAYRNWRQTDPRYNQAPAWPAVQFPEATFHFFKDCGCLVCALAMMLRHYGIEKTTDESLFNPWILNQRLIDCEAFYPTANLELARIERLYPLEYRGAVPYARDTLAQLAQDGLPCLITVPGVNASRHFTALYALTEDDALVMDPLSGERRLSSYEWVHDIRVFRPCEAVRRERNRPNILDGEGHAFDTVS